MKKILVAGSSNIDFVLRVAEMPRKGETIHTRSFHKIPGGKGANQACACGKLGGDCVFLSAVGKDGLGDIVLDSLRSVNVDVSKVLLDADTPSGMAVIAVNDEGENSIMIVPGANALCDRTYLEVNEDSLNASDYVLVQLETPNDDIYEFLEKAKSLGKTTILNPAPAPEYVPDHVLNQLDYITPNETELAKISDMKTDTIEEIETAARALLKKGVKNVLVTIGARGAFLCNESEAKVYPTIKVTPVDTTAAGDTFNAGFVVALASDMPVDHAIQFANVAASLSTTRAGAQPSIPSREEVEKICSNLI